MAKRKAPRKPVADPSLDEDLDTGFMDTEGGVVSVYDPESGRAYFAPLEPAGLKKLSPQAAQVLSELQSIVIHRRDLAMELEERVQVLRDLGVSWQLIGWSVGTSGEAARQRWG